MRRSMAIRPFAAVVRVANQIHSPTNQSASVRAKIGTVGAYLATTSTPNSAASEMTKRNHQPREVSTNRILA